MRGRQGCGGGGVGVVVLAVAGFMLLKVILSQVKLTENTIRTFSSAHP